jgi:hypothetical protein
MFVTFLYQPFVCDKWQHEHNHTDNVVKPYETMYFCTVRLLMKLGRIYSSAPVFKGNRFQELPRLRETSDNTERYI